MEKIIVREKEATSSGRRFTVLVGETGAVAEFTVDLADSYWEKLTSKRILREELIKKSFEFLLAHKFFKNILSVMDTRIQCVRLKKSCKICFDEKIWVDLYQCSA
jgi:hypothetical protein